MSAFYEGAAAPPIAYERSLITKPIRPTTPMPRRLIFIDNQSSSRPGLTANFKVLEACVSQDFIPILIAHPRFHLTIINIAIAWSLKTNPSILLKFPLQS
jgi:hypothetical protein